MTSRTIQTFTGNEVEYKVIKDGYKTVSQTIQVTDDLPTRNTYTLEPSSVVHGEDLDYTIDTDHLYPPVINFNENVETADGQEIPVNKYVLAPYGQDYLLLEGQQADNFGRVGGVSVSKVGQVDNFSTTNYLKLSSAFNPGAGHWEVKMKFTSSSDVTTNQKLFHSCMGAGGSGRYGIGIAFSSNGFDFFCSSSGTAWLFDTYGTYRLLTNTTYWVKFGWTGTEYYLDYSTDGETYIRDITYSSTSSVYASLVSTYIGIYSYDSFKDPFLGSIDLSETSITVNNSSWWEPTWNKLADNFYTYGAITRSSSGVASTFSDSRYIFPYFSPETENWEFITKVNVGSQLSSHHNQLLNNTSKNYAVIITRQGTSGTPMSTYINSGWTNGTTSLSASNNYWVRFVYNNRVCKCYLKLDNSSSTECPATSNMTLQWTVTASSSFVGDKFTLSVANSEYWGGSIDLEKTKFIEGDRTWKYKSVYSLNANVLGLPTITEDKKVYDITTTRYLQMLKMFNPGNNPWLMQFKFKQDTLNSTWKALFGSYYGDFSCGAHLYVTQNGCINFELGQGSSWNISGIGGISSGVVFTANKWYWTRLEFTGTAYNAYLSEDGINFRQISTLTSSTPITATQKQTIGCDQYAGGDHYLNGSIDLLESYIKIDGEYWWKGSDQTGEFVPGILDSSVTDTGDPVTLNLYDVEKDGRTLILNTNRDVTVDGKEFVQYDGEIDIPEHGLSLYDSKTQSWSKYRYITLEVDDPDTTLYITGNID